MKETNIIEICFDIKTSHNDVFTEFSLNGSGLCDSITKEIKLNFISTQFEVKGECIKDSWSLVKNPSLTEEGMLVRKCVNDETHLEQYILPKLNKNDYNYSIDDTSCNDNGLEKYSYTIDGQIFDFEIVTNAFGHNYKVRL